MSKQDSNQEHQPKVIKLPTSPRTRRAIIGSAIYIVIVAAIAIFGVASCVHGVKLQREARETLTTAQELKAEALQLESNSELLKQLSDLEYDLLEWTDKNGQKELYYCSNLSVRGPFETSDAHIWYTEINGKYTSYGVGTYEKFGEQRLYNRSPTLTGGYRVDTYQLIKVGEYVYELEACYYDVDLSEYRSSIYVRERCKDFRISIDCVRGRNNIVEGQYEKVCYDDMNNVNRDEPEATPCGCTNCCCDVCVCNQN